MKASQLRDLTRRFAAGKLGREEYEAERRRLIDGIVSGDVEIRYRDIYPPRPHAAKPGAKRRQLIMIGGGGGLILLLLAAFAAHFLQPQTLPPEKQASGAPIPEPGVALLEEFLAADNWSDESLANFEQEWQSLTPFQREAARRSHLHRRLKTETENRIREYEALMAIDGNGEHADALLKAARLRAFAERLELHATQ